MSLLLLNGFYILALQQKNEKKGSGVLFFATLDIQNSIATTVRVDRGREAINIGQPLNILLVITKITDNHKV